MNKNKQNMQDGRMDQILDVIVKFVKSDFKARAVASDNGDELDAIITGLNTLGEELSTRLFFQQENERRINEIMNVLLQYTLMDFSQKNSISEKGDELDAIAVGLNTLSEELESNITELKASQERFSLIIENAKDYAMIMLDTNGIIKSWNIGAERIKGYSAEEIIGRHFSVFYTEEEKRKKDPEEHLRMAKENGRLEIQNWRIRKNGSLFFGDVIYTALYDRKGNLRGYSKITRDITEHKHAEEIIKQKSDELARSNKDLEQFAYVASHDLQEPLRMVSSFLQLLEKQLSGKLDKDSKEYIDFAIDGSKRMKNMIDDLLSYSRIISGKAQFEKTDMNKMLQEVKNNLRESILESKANINIGKMPILNADSIKIMRLFQNLMANAIKFKTKNTMPVVEINCTEKADAYLFSVKDNGIGIKKEYHEKIFLIFQRLNSKEEYPGTGIGLAECQKIVTLHGGKIWVESEQDKGSTFYFTIKKFLAKSLLT